MATGRDSIHLLVVDAPSEAERTADRLTALDDRFTVETATSAAAALEDISSEGVDCVVTGAELPDCGCVEFVRRVRDDRADLPVIVFTAEGSERLASDAVAAGATDYVPAEPRPEAAASLADRIRERVRSYRDRSRTARQSRVEALLRELNRRLVEAETVPEIERDVCRTLADAAPYRLAWIGAPDAETECVVPSAAAGDGADRIDDLAIDVDRDPGQESPPARAALTREPQHVADVAADPSTDPCRLVAEEYGFESVLALPLECESTLHGVLVVYADEPRAFDETERAVLAELAATISEAIQAAETRRRLEEREQELAVRSRAIEAAPVGVSIADATREDNPIVDVNERFQELTGYAVSELLGHNHRLLQGEATEPEPVAELRAGIDAAEPVTTTLRNYRKDGTEFWNRVTVAPVRDDDDELTHFVGFQDDVTDRKERERELERYREMGNTAGDMVYILDRDGNLEFVNDAAETLTGYSRDELVGSHVSLFMNEADVETGRELIRDLLDAGDVPSDGGDDPAHGDDPAYSDVFEWTLTRADGTTLPCESQITLLQEDGEWRGTVGVVRDVTERVERERKLERERDRLDRFASIVSHDLRNPLNVAAGNLDLARDEVESDRLETAADALDRMETLIEELLRLAREGASVEDTAPVALADAVGATWTNVDTAAARLDVETDATVVADESRLRQLLENLVRNAVEHGGETVTVTVGDLPGGGFYVADDGPGIPESEREQVFEFGHTTTSDGTGYGLGIVAEIAEAHGWDVAITESADGGARFEVTGVEFE